jgi:hypothetical protein
MRGIDWEQAICAALKVQWEGEGVLRYRRDVFLFDIKMQRRAKTKTRGIANTKHKTK